MANCAQNQYKLTPLCAAGRQYYGKNFTDEEWLENFQSTEFMRETYGEGLSKYKITNEQLQQIIDNIVVEKGLNSKKHI